MLAGMVLEPRRCEFGGRQVPSPEGDEATTPCQCETQCERITHGFGMRQNALSQLTCVIWPPQGPMYSRQVHARRDKAVNAKAHNRSLPHRRRCRLSISLLSI